MFDTMSINRIITKRKFDKIIKIHQCQSRKTSKGRTIYKTRKLYKHGFDEITLSTLDLGNGDPPLHYLTIRIRFASVIFDVSDLRVVSYQDLIDNEFEKKINDMIRKYLWLDYNFDEFQTKRLDCALDYDPEEGIKPCHLIYLFNKSRGIRRGKFRKLRKQGSLYIKSRAKRQRIRVNCYDKHDQILKKVASGKAIPEINMRQIENKCRLEIQCLSAKISQLMDEFNIKSRNPMEFLTPNFALKIIEKYLSGVIGREDFYSMKYAKQKIISAKGIMPDMKKKLITTLILIKDSRDMDSAKKSFTSKGRVIPYYKTDERFHGCDSTFDAYIKQIRALGINPVVVPRNWHIDHIDNPVRVIFKDEKTLAS